MSLEATSTIVHGYVRDIFQGFPSDLVKVIISYIKNFVENSGMHRIQINDPDMVNKMLNADCEEKFEMKPFTLSRIKCRLVIYPNGDKPELKGYFILHLFMDLPGYIDTITFSRVFRVKESYTSSSWLSTISNGEYEYWSKHCPLQDIIMINPISLTIEIELNIHELTLKNESYLSLLEQCKLPKIKPAKYDTKIHIEYILNENELNMIRKCQPDGKSMCSDIVDNMWCMEISPRETNIDGVDLRIRAMYFPGDVEIFEVKYEAIKCIEIGKQTQANILVHFSLACPAYGYHPWINLEQIENLDQLTLIADIEIKRVRPYKKNDPLKIFDQSHITYLLSV